MSKETKWDQFHNSRTQTKHLQTPNTPNTTSIKDRGVHDNAKTESNPESKAGRGGNITHHPTTIDETPSTLPTSKSNNGGQKE
jgi:hypothetical protein